MGGIRLVLYSGTGKGGRVDEGYAFSFAVVGFQEEMLGCVGWWGRGQLLRKSEVAYVTLCGRSDVGVRRVCHHHYHHLGPQLMVSVSVICDFSLQT